MFDTNQLMISVILCWISVSIILMWCRPARCMVADEKDSSKRRMCMIRLSMCSLLITLMVLAIITSVSEYMPKRHVSSFGFYY